MDPLIVGKTPARESRPAPNRAWKALLGFSLLFVVLGWFDIALAFYPPRFGEAPWRFAILAGVIGGLPIVSLGLVGGLMAALALESAGWVRVFTVLNGLMVIAILLGFVVFGLAISPAFAAARQEALPGLREAVLRTYLLGSLYGGLNLLAVRYGRDVR